MFSTDSKLKALQMLQLWGLRISGSTIKDPTKPATGGQAGIDEDQLVVEFVEETPNFRVARPVLVHRYVQGLEFSTFTLRIPGETKRWALIRLGWFQFVGIPERKIPQLVHDEFVALVATRIEALSQGGPANFYFS